MDTIAFYLLAAGAVLSASLAAGMKNVVHAIIAFASLLICIAGLFGLLGAPFIAIGQLVIFVGGMISLLLFGVMFNTDGNTDPKTAPALRAFSGAVIARAVAGIAFTAALVLTAVSYIPIERETAALPDFAHFSTALFGSYWEAVILGFFGLFIAIVTAAFLLEDEHIRQ